MKQLLLLLLLTQSCYAQIFNCLIKVGEPDLPQFIIRPDCNHLDEPNLYKRKEKVLIDINLEFDKVIENEKNKIDSLYIIKYQLLANGVDTSQIVETIIQQNTYYQSIVANKTMKVQKLEKFLKPKIILEYETSAFYSLPNYKGKKYIIKGNNKGTTIPFYPKSIRVARNCRIKVYPFHDYQEAKSYGTSEFKKSAPILSPNVNSGSMVSDPTIFRATSWKLICK